MSGGWKAALADRLAPKVAEPDSNTLAWLLPLFNLIRRAKGLPSQTLAEALEERRRTPPVDPRVFARLLDEARSRVAEDEARLCGRES